MNRLTIADTMELENVLDFIPEGKRAEAVSFLIQQYGVDNLDCYDSYGLVDLDEMTIDDIMDNFDVDDILEKVKDDVLLSWIDKGWLYRNIKLQKVLEVNSDIDILDEIEDEVIAKYLKGRGYDVEFGIPF